MKRRSFLKKSAGFIAASAPLGNATSKWTTQINQERPDVVVIGAGVFGVWTAFYLRELGAKVTLLDAYGAGNSRASSGGESRILRADYGDRLLYSRMNIRAHELWSKWQEEWGTEFLLSTGRLTLGDRKYREKAKAAQGRLSGLGIESEILEQTELAKRWPQLRSEGIDVGLYFPGGAGGSTLMAREATRITCENFVKYGGSFQIERAEAGVVDNGRLRSVRLNSGKSLEADKYIFACGPWMAKVFPEIFSDQLKVFRRDVFFVGSPPGDPGYAYPNFPVWSFVNSEDIRYYGMPDIHGRGLKVAPWPDYNSIDVDMDDRLSNTYELKRVREFVSRRFPGLKDQPFMESRVCQLTFSSDEHFIVDQHPDAANLWFVCAGSGHGFKHGPALGEYVADRVLNNSKNEEYDKAFKLKKP